MLLPKYQRFVAWRYLLERQRSLSNGILLFLGVFLSVALAFALASALYPMTDAIVMPGPRPNMAQLGIVCWLWVLPLISIGGAAVQALRKRDPLDLLLVGLNFAVCASAALYLWNKASTPEGLSTLEMVLSLILPWMALSLPVTTWLARNPPGPFFFFVLLIFSPLVLVVVVFSVMLARWGQARLRAISPIIAFGVSFFTALIEVLIGYLAVLGLKQVLWPSLTKLWEGAPSTALFALPILALMGIAAGVVLRRQGRGARVLHVSLAIALLLALVLLACPAVVYIKSIGLHLTFFGGWAKYTPPMPVIIPAIAAAALSILCFVLLWVRYFFTFFTTVSIGGVTIGTMALVIVLSVMSGFENDLREKILGFNAHIQISRNDELQFEGYQEVEKVLSETKGVVGYTPFLTTEAYMSNHNNYANVTLKGIDPDRVASVTEIVHNLEKGDDRALEKIWPLAEDGSILGRPVQLPLIEEGEGGDLDLDLGGPEDFSGGVEEMPVETPDDEAAEAAAADDLDLDLGPPEDFSGGLEEIPDALVDDELDEDELDDADPEDMDELLVDNDYVEPEVAILDGVLVGRELVKHISLYTNLDIRVISPLPDVSPDGMSIPRTKNYRIAGRFYSGMYEYDLKYVYTSLSSLQDFLDLGDVVNGIEVRVKDPRNTAGIVKSLEERLGDSYRVQDWKDLNRALFSALKLEKIAMFFVLVIIVLVASFSIVGNLIMVVVEKAKEIAILKTLGSSDPGVMKIFITQGFFIGLVGTLLGVAMGLGICYLGITYGVPLDPDVYYIDKLPIQVEAGSVSAVGSAGVAISVIATIYPAFMAARMRPVKGLRWD